MYMTKNEVSFLISYDRKMLSFVNKRKFRKKLNYLIQFLVIT